MSKAKGRPPPKAKPLQSPLMRILICPDVHVPYHDKKAWDTFLEVAAAFQWDAVILLGDFCDFYQVSQYRKDPKRKASLEEDLKAANWELDRLMMQLGNTPTVFCEGNHETRLSRYIADKCPELHAVCPDAERALEMGSRGWKWVPYGELFRLGKLAFTHGAHVGENAARRAVAEFGGNVIFGHTHRAQLAYRSSLQGERHVGATLGWLGDAAAIDYEQRWKTARDCQLGFGVAYLEKRTGHGWVSFIPIIGGKAALEGRLIG